MHQVSSNQTIVYNIFEHEELGIYLASAHISTQDKKGRLAYVQQLATQETVGSYGFEIEGKGHKDLIGICEKISIPALELRYNRANRKPKSLAVLLEDEKLKPLLIAYVDKKIHQFLTIVVQNDYPLCWNIERKVFLEDIRIRLRKSPLRPKLSFVKDDKGIKYRMVLNNGQTKWRVAGNEVYPIVNHPGWLFINYELWRLDGMNGNKVKPFLKKDIVNIPNRMVKEYFQKFIMDVVGQVEMETEGFSVETVSSLQYCRLETSEDFIEGKLLLKVVFDYDGSRFYFNEKADRRTRLNFEEGDDIQVTQIVRDRVSELVYISKLEQMGLKAKGNGFSPIDKKGEELSLIAWLQKHKSDFQSIGLQFDVPVIGGRTINLDIPNIQLNVKKGNDWFDLHGVITVGDFEFPFSKLLENIKIENRYYKLPDGTYFYIPMEWMHQYRNLAKFVKKRQGKLQLPKSNYTLLQEVSSQSMRDIVVDEEEVLYHPSPLLKADLRPYQLDGVKWLVKHYENGLGACLADDMGLGKTLQTIAVLVHAKGRIDEAPEEEATGLQLDMFTTTHEQDLRPLRALIVLPASLIFNWMQELRKFAPHLIPVNYTGPQRKKVQKVLHTFDVVLTTYQTALKDENILSNMEFEYIVLDESQQIKNKNSKVFKAINTFKTKHKISLSGTPIENSLSDLWSQMQFINPDILGSYEFFKKHFLIPIEKNKDEEIREEAKEQLQKMVQPFIMRRTKEEVAKDLPALSEQVYYVDMDRDQRRLYEQEKSAARNFLLGLSEQESSYKFHVLQSLMKLRQISNHPKLVDEDYSKGSGKFYDVTNYLETIFKSNHKVLLFSSFKKQLNLYRDWLVKEKIGFTMLTGDTPTRNRKTIVEQFQSDESIQAFLISIKAGGTGLNLTAADYVFILDPWWNPFVEQQAIARAHRIGQNKNVMVVRFISKDSIEEKILKLQAQKKSLSDDIIGAGKMPDLSRREVDLLLR